MRHRNIGWFVPALAALTLVASPQAGRAQMPPPTAAPAGPSLSPAQQARVKARQQKFSQDMTALQSSKTLTPAQKSAKFQTMYHAMDTDMLAILTPQQRAQVLAQRQGQTQKRQAFLKAHQAEITEGKTLAAKLNKSITPAQKSQVDAIKKQLAAQGRQIGADKSLSPQAKQQKFMADQQQAQAKMQAILTPAQKADIQKMQQIQQKLAAEAGGPSAR